MKRRKAKGLGANVLQVSGAVPEGWELRDNPGIENPRLSSAPNHLSVRTPTVGISPAGVPPSAFALRAPVPAATAENGERSRGTGAPKLGPT
jgi:hypothetical protein